MWTTPATSSREHVRRSLHRPLWPVTVAAAEYVKLRCKPDSHYSSASGAAELQRIHSTVSFLPLDCARAPSTVLLLPWSARLKPHTRHTGEEADKSSRKSLQGVARAACAGALDATADCCAGPAASGFAACVPLLRRAAAAAAAAPAARALPLPRPLPLPLLLPLPLGLPRPRPCVLARRTIWIAFFVAPTHALRPRLAASAALAAAAAASAARCWSAKPCPPTEACDATPA